MAIAKGPVSGRRRLRSALRRARDSNGLTQEQVAQIMDWSLSKIIRIENGSVGISTNDLRALLNLYNVTEPTAVDYLIELAKIGRSKPWWADYRDYISSPEFQTLIGLETNAASISVFNQSVFTGLLQSESYARKALRVISSTMPDDELEARVAVRIRRQRELFDRADAPTVSVILDEATIHRMTDDPIVMSAQVEHLLQMMSRPNVSIRVVPFNAGIYLLVPSFFILSFPGDEDPDVVYTDNYLNEDIIEDGGKVTRYHDAFRSLNDSSLSQDDSVALIQKITKEHG